MKKKSSNPQQLHAELPAAVLEIIRTLPGQRKIKDVLSAERYNQLFDEHGDPLFYIFDHASTAIEGRTVYLENKKCIFHTNADLSSKGVDTSLLIYNATVLVLVHDNAITGVCCEIDSEPGILIHANEWLFLLNVMAESQPRQHILHGLLVGNEYSTAFPKKNQVTSNY